MKWIDRVDECVSERGMRSRQEGNYIAIGIYGVGFVRGSLFMPGED